MYGQLPPETRSQQARLFNDPTSGYDILVASDAIGMGLNLNIRRIIFHSLLKTAEEGGAERIEPGTFWKDSNFQNANFRFPQSSTSKQLLSLKRIRRSVRRINGWLRPVSRVCGYVCIGYVKQIGGRAGRRSSQWQGGSVTCLREEDMAYLTQAMHHPVQQIQAVRTHYTDRRERHT